MKHTVYILLVIFFFGQASLGQETLASDLMVRIGKTNIPGWQGSSEEINSAQEWVESLVPEGEKAPAEGFLYHRKNTIGEAYEILAWSSKGRSTLILNAAKDMLTNKIQIHRSKENQPAGYLFSNNRKYDFSAAQADPSSLPRKLKGPSALSQMASQPSKQFGPLLASNTVEIFGPDTQSSLSSPYLRHAINLLCLILFTVLLLIAFAAATANRLRPRN